MSNGALSEQNEFRLDEQIVIELDLSLHRYIENFHLYLRVYRDDDILVLATADWTRVRWSQDCTQMGCTRY